MKIIGHRGASGYAPENTLASFRKALDLNVDMIELDVHRIKSGELIVIHDATLDRTTNGRGHVADKTLAEVRTLDAGDGERVPLLSDVLDLIDKQIQVNIELKGNDTAEPTAEIVSYYVSSRGWPPSAFLVSSFRRDEIKRFAKIQPETNTGALFRKLPSQYENYTASINASAVSLNARFITSAHIERVKASNLEVFAYTVNRPEQLQRLKSIGVDGVFTDYPDRASIIDKEVVAY